MPFGRKSPLEALALPGVMLAYKYSQFRQRRREAASRRVTERELAALHHKIDKLLSKLEESDPDPPTSQEDECVICINARATMQTSPCGHRVVCRRCFVKTIQSAVAQRLLPLRCVICRARVNRLTSSSGTWRIQESASSYSMGGKSWSSAGGAAGGGGVHTSHSSYSVGDVHSGGAGGGSSHTFHPQLHGHGHGSGGGGGGIGPGGRYSRSPNGRVAQSASLYSMSSTGSSSMSAVSHGSAYSKTSSLSSGLSSPQSPLSPAVNGTTYAHSTASVLNNHLAPPPTASISAHHQHGPPHSSLSSSSPSPTSGCGSLSPRDHNTHSHSHHAGCPSGCSGAVPRKPLHGPSLSNSSSSGSCSSAGSSSGIGASISGGGGGSGGNGMGNGIGLGGGYGCVFAPTTHTYPGRRYPKSRLVDRLPPIKEFRSPAKVPHTSPVHVSNPRFRYSSYTKTNSHEMKPLLHEPPSPPRRPLNIQITSSLTLAPPPLKAGGAKISPANAKPKNAYLAPKEKKAGGASSGAMAKANGSVGNNNANSAGKKDSSGGLGLKGTATSGAGSGGGRASNSSTLSSSSSRSFPLFSSNNHKEKADNKKNESMERKKKEDKQKVKAEKEARKEEKRLAKEEERLAKLLAKEEKRKGKKEAKELLLANDGNNKK